MARHHDYWQRRITLGVLAVIMALVVANAYAWAAYAWALLDTSPIPR